MLRWYAAGMVAAVAIAWLSAVVHGTGHAPIGLVSLGVGAALGAILSVMAASLRLAGRRLFVGTILLALVTVFAQHAWLYYDFRRQWQDARSSSAEAAMFRPETPWSPREYFSAELTAGRAVVWCTDAVLITGAAAATVLMVKRHRQ